ncbi:MAG: FMN-binding protein [Candidatus Omnitrophota bacterium]
MIKKTFIIVTAVIVFAALVIGGLKVYEAKEIMNMQIDEIDLSNVPDGVYAGEEKYMTFVCKVKVTVKKNQIVDIEAYEGRESEYVERAKEVADRVIANQSLEVDTVTGATVTSKAILKAIENALKSSRID